MATLSHPTEQSITTFTLFPNLPSELRLKIWSLIIPGARDIDIFYKLMRRSKRAPIITFQSSTPTPSILHVNHESRTEGLKSLSLAFENIYTNFLHDTFVFGDGTGNEPLSYPLLDILLEGDFRGANDVVKIRHLSIDICEDHYDRRTFIWEEIRQFTSLKRLNLYVWEEDSMRDELMMAYNSGLKDLARKHPEWVIPRIEVWTNTGSHWGLVTVEDEE